MVNTTLCIIILRMIVSLLEMKKYDSKIDKGIW